MDKLTSFFEQLRSLPESRQLLEQPLAKDTVAAARALRDGATNLRS